MTCRKVVVTIVSLIGLVCAMSSDAKDPIDTVSDGKEDPTVSHDASKDPPFEWTLERMLLAQPMPMTAEGRKFLSTHPNLDGIRTWDAAQFDKYLDSAYAKQHIAEEAVRWRDLAVMLDGQVTRGSQFLGKAAQPSTSKTKCLVDWNKLSMDDINKMLDGKEKSAVFAQMKIWRQQIADLAPKVEAMRKEAEGKGLTERLEQVLTPD